MLLATLYRHMGERRFRDEFNRSSKGSFHYKPSVAWPPLPGDGVTVKMPHGADEHFDEQIQMYW